MLAWWLERDLSEFERQLAAVGRYALAIALVAATFLLRAQYEAEIGGRALLLMFMLPVVVSAAVGGFGPGLLATALVAFGVAWSVFPPLDALWVEDPLDQIQLVLAVAGGTLVTWLFERVRSESLTRAADEESRRQQQRFKTALDGLIEGCQIIDPGYRYLYLNRVAETHARTSAANLIGRRMVDCYPGIERTEVFKAIERCMRERVAERLEHEFVYPDGEKRWYELRIEPIEEGVFILSLDITERTRNEIKLREQVLRLELLNRITRAIRDRLDLASLYASVVLRVERDMPLDLAAVLLRIEGAEALKLAFIGQRNRALLDREVWPDAARLPVAASGLGTALAGAVVHEPDLGASHSEVAAKLRAVGLRSMVAVPLAVEGRAFGVLLAARVKPQAFSSGECEFLRQLGEHVALGAHETELHLTIKRAYDDLRDSREEIARHERINLLGQMASGVAHDVNNAMSPIRMLAELMLEGESGLSAGAREDLATILRAVDGVSQTIDRLQQLYRKRDTIEQPEPIDLKRAVQHAIELASVRWREPALMRTGRIEVVTEFDGVVPPALGNEAEVREALVNLIFNAIDAMPSGGQITLRARTDAMLGGAVLEVADTGMGMDERTQARCFDPFFTTKGEQGSGLGLSMVYGTVQRHGGAIEVVSAPGRGTTFRWRFPLARAPSVPHGAAADEPVAAPRLERRLTVLTVDDDPLVLRSLGDMLTADGHAVTAVDGGEAAIGLLRSAGQLGTPYDIVITDLGMPDADGRAVARAAKEALPGVPVLMLTGWGRRAEMTREELPHVDRLLGKPPRLPELRAALCELCGPDPRQPM